MVMERVTMQLLTHRFTRSRCWRFMSWLIQAHLSHLHSWISSEVNKHMRKTICLVDDLVLSIIFFSISLSSGFHCLLSLLLLALGMAVGISLWKNKTLIDLVLCCGRSSRFRDFVAIEVALSRDWEEVVTIV